MFKQALVKVNSPKRIQQIIYELIHFIIQIILFNYRVFLRCPLNEENIHRRNLMTRNINNLYFKIIKVVR